MTTKEQERKALAQIKKIVAGLGEDSYIGTAFEGCFELAEENIENDFACSWKQRAEAADRDTEQMRERVANLQGINSTLRLINESNDRVIKQTREELEAAQAKQLPVDLFVSILSHYIDTADKTRKHMAILADTMAHYADAPQDIAFQRAVGMYRNEKTALAELERIIEGLQKFDTRNED